MKYGEKSFSVGMAGDKEFRDRWGSDVRPQVLDLQSAEGGWSVLLELIPPRSDG